MLDGDLVGEHDLAFFVQQLGASEACRYEQFSRRERQRQFLLGRMLLRFASSELTGLPHDAIGVVERPDDAPRLVLPDSDCPLKFSLSHSQNWISCVVSADAMVAVDIEVNDQRRDFVASGELIFHPNDYLWLLSQPDAARASAFYQLWSMREALLKLDSAIGRESAPSPLVGADGQFASQGSDWFGYALSRSDFMLVVCSDRPLTELRKVKLSGLSRADWPDGEQAFVTYQFDSLNELNSFGARPAFADKTD